ncbi:MAG: extracellular solute-binding protein, partial [Aristaeellaceae bacterium]
AALAEISFPLDEPMTFDIIVKQSANDIGTNYGDKPCIQRMTEDTNVQINWTAYNGSTWNDKVTMQIASNDLPDAFSGGGVNVQRNYDVFVDLTPYLEEYMPTWNKYLNDNPIMKDALTMTDGGIYCLPVAGSDYNTFYADGMLYINDTFLNNYLDGKVPTTLEEMHQALIIARDNDINGNGIADEIPLLACEDYKDGLNSMLSYFGIALDKSYVMYNDNTCREVSFMANTQAYKEALTTLADWYREGLINADVFSMSGSDYTSRYQESDSVAFCITHTPDFNFADGLTDWTLVTYLDNGDYDNMFLAESSYGTMDGFVITTACEHPEVLCAWFDAIHADFETWAEWNFGEKGKIWDYAEDGVHFVSCLMGEAKESGLSYARWRQTYAPHTGGPKYGGMYQELMTYLPEELEKGGSRNYYVVQMNEQIREENKRFSTDRLGYWDEDKTERLDELELAINEYCAAFKANAIVNGFTDADWDSYCRELESKLHVEEYVSLYNEYLSRND